MARARKPVGKPITVKQVREIASNNISPAWAEPGLEPQEDAELIGVGRAGTPPRKTGRAGLSRRERSRTEIEGTDKLRVNRPGRPGNTRRRK